MLTEIIREAWVALRRNYTRSLLTMVGVVWGIATVTLLIAYGSSFRNILVSGFDAFGKGAVICWPQQTSEQPGGQRAGKKVVFEKADVDLVKETAPLVKHVCLETVHRPGIAYGDRMVGTAAVRGVCPEYGEMRNEVASEGSAAAMNSSVAGCASSADACESNCSVAALLSAKPYSLVACDSR
jgi:putative ABC transport system permease protein